MSGRDSRLTIPRRIGGVGVVSGAICLAALVYLIWRNAAAWPSLEARFDGRYLAIAFLFHACALIAAAYTWHRIVAAAADEKQRSRNIRIYVTSAFARRLPGSLWGPALRIYWYRRLGGDWRTVGVASVLEIWALTVSGVLLTLIGAVFYIHPFASARTWIGLGLLLVVLSAMLTPNVNRFLMQKLPRLLGAAPGSALGSIHWLELVRWIAVELITWICGGLMLAALLRAIWPFELTDLPFIVACWAAAGTAGVLITFVPGGFGVVELALTGLLGLLVPTSVALATAVGLRIFVSACEILWMIGGFATPSISARLRQPAQGYTPK